MAHQQRYKHRTTDRNRDKRLHEYFELARKYSVRRFKFRIGDSTVVLPRARILPPWEVAYAMPRESENIIESSYDFLKLERIVTLPVGPNKSDVSFVCYALVTSQWAVQ